MAKRYRSPIVLDGPVDPGFDKSIELGIDAIREMKDEISTSFVYGDETYEEEYIVPDVVEEILVTETASEEVDE